MSPTLSLLRPQSSAAPWQPVDRFEPSTPDDSALFKSLRQMAAQQPYYDASADREKQRAYYGDLTSRIERLNPQETYRELSTLVERTHTTELPYNPSETLYPWVDLRPDGQLHSIYSGSRTDAASLIEDDKRRQADLDKALKEAREAALKEGRDPEQAVKDAYQGFHLNCEHVVPQSWFDKRSPMRGDLHHLFACDVDCNSLRGNSLYTDFPEKVGGDCGKKAEDQNRFEPAAGKGAVARATLYFLLRYPGQVGDESGEYRQADIPTLLKWHREDPVSDYERHRNVAIEGKQGNRNPLIDHPEWADRIDWNLGLGRH
ncbi:MAG: hypothetical protein AMXMBFR33_24280 [Candidatus Xenobia bacterium]